MFIVKHFQTVILFLGCGLLLAGCKTTDSGEEERYSQTIMITDSEHTIDLQFGMDTRATAGYDKELDIEAPPAPPENTFYAHFVITEYNLYSDYRPLSTENTVWELKFDSEEDQNLTLEWDIDSNNGMGILTLVDDTENPSIDIVMTEENSYQPDDSLTNLFIVQER